MVALGTTVRPSRNPAERASALTGGTPALDEVVVAAARTGYVAAVVESDEGVGDAGPTPGAPQLVLQTTTSTAIKNRRTITISALSPGRRVVQATLLPPRDERGER